MKLSEKFNDLRKHRKEIREECYSFVINNSDNCKCLINQKNLNSIIMGFPSDLSDKKLEAIVIEIEKNMDKERTY
jgi:hypothetical protein